MGHVHMRLCRNIACSALAVLLGCAAALPAAAAAAGREISAPKGIPYRYNDEAPPTAVGLFIGLGLLVLFIAAPIVISRRRRARDRLRTWQAAVGAATPLAPLEADPLHIEQAVGAAKRFARDLDQAWAERDQDALRRLVAPEAEPWWTTTLRRSTTTGRHLRIDEHGPIDVAFVAALAPEPGEDDRVAVRVSGRLREAGAPPPGNPARRRRTVAVGCGLAVVVFAALIAFRGSPPAAAGPPVAQLDVAAAVRAPKPQELTFRPNQRFVLLVRSASPTTVRVRGIGVTRAIVPAAPARVALRIPADGQYLVETLPAHHVVAVVEVRR